MSYAYANINVYIYIAQEYVKIDKLYTVHTLPKDNPTELRIGECSGHVSKFPKIKIPMW